MTLFLLGQLTRFLVLNEGDNNYVVPVVKRIIIDEFGMISAGLWRKFAEYKHKNPNCIFQIFGDDEQTKCVSDSVKMRGVETDLIVKYLCNGNVRYIKEHPNMRCDINTI